MTKYKIIKNRVFEIMNGDEKSGLAGKIVNYFIFFLIILNIVSLMAETVRELAAACELYFKLIEVFSIIIFTIEYAVRLWSATADPKYKKPVLGRLRYAFTPLAFIDLLAFLPFYLPVLIPIDLRVLRAFRMFRLFRIFKVARYSKSLKLMGNVFQKRKGDVFVAIALVLILLVIVSNLMYNIEHEAQPETFKSIFDAMWWGMATLTTIGANDIGPVTSGGKLLGIITAFLGIGIFALPTAILGSGFIEELEMRKESPKVCPHCGKEIDKSK